MLFARRHRRRATQRHGEIGDVMSVRKSATLIVRAAAWVAVGLASGQALAAATGPEAGAHPAATPDDATCLNCHDGSRELTTLPDEDGDTRPLKAIDPERYARSVHGENTCVNCHREIVDSTAPHTIADLPRPDCATCHEALWDEVKKQDLVEEKSRLGIVVSNIDAYRESFHARRSKRGAKATCDDCHDTHFFNVPPRGTAKRTAWHLTVPQVCGESCHDDVLEEYASSVHGVAVLEDGNPKAAICTDCHTSHDIAKTTTDTTELLFVENCGGCHKESLETYRDTYHGQVGQLGYAYTAKCFDCHGSHDIRKVDDPESMVHVDNRLETCQECHDGKKRGLATAGFVTFSPHANASDFERYPQVWFAKKFMDGLLIFVFAFFWAHTLLWWYREAKDRREHKAEVHVRTEEALQGNAREVRRFGLAWRIAHLFFALSIMILVLTGMGLFYPATPLGQGRDHMARGSGDRWHHPPRLRGDHARHLLHPPCRGFDRDLAQAPDVPLVRPRLAGAELEGSPGRLGHVQVVRRPAASGPLFDRWTYCEKFDYWAVFWGMAIIGDQRHDARVPRRVTATYLPGWVFNVATVVHGEEAFLAAVFLFTVHFFNNHFRPDKMPPPNVVMFTGLQSMDEFRREHPAQYQRLVESGELEKYLVKAPSRPMTIASQILGIVLIAFGLVLLVFVAVGFFGD